MTSKTIQQRINQMPPDLRETCGECGEPLAKIEIDEAVDTGFRECRDCGIKRRSIQPKNGTPQNAMTILECLKNESHITNLKCGNRYLFWDGFKFVVREVGRKEPDTGVITETEDESKAVAALLNHVCGNSR